MKIGLAFLAIAAAAFSFSGVGTAAPQPVPTLTVVPLVPSVLEAAFKHVTSYTGEFTLDYQDTSGNSEHLHADVTLHFDRSYADAGDRGVEMLWQGFGHADATYSSKDCSGSAVAPPNHLLVELFEDLGRHLYRLNTYGVQVSCGSDRPQVGGFSSTPVTILPPPSAVICGTMTVVASGDFTEHDSWSFVPKLDNGSRVVHQSCPQVTPLPNEE
jgi:hypothetical protein